LLETLPGIGNDPLGIDLEQRAQAVAGLARPERRVEREAAGLNRIDAGTALGTCRALTEYQVRALFAGDRHHALRQLERGFDRVRQAVARALLDRQPVDHDFQVVSLVARQFRRILELDPRPVDAGAQIALALGVVHLLAVFAFSAPHDRRQQRHALARTRGQDLVHHLLDALASQRGATVHA